MKNQVHVTESLHDANLLKQLEYRFGGRPQNRPDTLQEERCQVLDGILDSLRWGTGDPEARTACRVLLRHLAVTPSHC